MMSRGREADLANHLVEYFTMNYKYGCRGAKSQIVKPVTTGFVTTLGGEEYEADAWDGEYYDCTV